MQSRKSPTWSYNLLTNVVLMFEPSQVILELKLHHVSRTFRRAVKEVAPYQMDKTKGWLNTNESKMQAIIEKEELGE